MIEREIPRKPRPDILNEQFNKDVHPYTMMFLFLAYDEGAYNFLVDDLQRKLFDLYFTSDLSIEGQKDISGRINLEKEIKQGFIILRRHVSPDIRNAFKETLLPYFKFRDLSFIDNHELELKKIRYANLSLLNKGKKLTEEHKRKIGDSNRGKKQPSEAVERMRKSKIGKKHSPEQLAKMKVVSTNMWANDEFKKAMKKKLIERWSDKTFKEIQSRNRRGKKLTEEHKQNISRAKKGKKHSEEAKRKMTEAALRRNAKKRALSKKSQLSN